MDDDKAADAAQLAREQEYVILALEQASMLVAGMDAVVAHMNLHPEVVYSALRTRLEQAKPRAAAVLAHLRGQQAPRPRTGP